MKKMYFVIFFQFCGTRVRFSLIMTRVVPFTYKHKYFFVFFFSLSLIQRYICLLIIEKTLFLRRYEASRMLKRPHDIHKLNAEQVKTLNEKRDVIGVAKRFYLCKTIISPLSH